MAKRQIEKNARKCAVAGEKNSQYARYSAIVAFEQAIAVRSQVLSWLFIEGITLQPLCEIVKLQASLQKIK